MARLLHSVHICLELIIYYFNFYMQILARLIAKCSYLLLSEIDNA